MRFVWSLHRYIFISTILMLVLSGGSLASELRFSSTKYLYSVSLPTGWYQIPSAEIVRLMAENYPPQAKHLIYEVAFQRGNTGKWFAWPYIIIQIIPTDRTKLNRLPTESEFQQFVNYMSGGKVVTKLKVAIDSVPHPEDKSYLNSVIPSLSKPSIQVEMASRKFWYLIDGNDPDLGPIKIYSAGTFMPDGNVVVVHGYTNASRFNKDFGQFLTVSRSLIVRQPKK